MKQLWAPWRMTYIQDAVGNENDNACIFCAKSQAETSEDQKNLVIYRGSYCFIMMNLYPYNTGHLLIAPYQHTGTLTQIPAETAQELFALTQKSEAALTEALHPHGFNLGMNLGKIAGAGFPNHAHMHIVPRWEGDTNFMPVLADVKIMPEFMEQTYAKITAAFEKK